MKPFMFALVGVALVFGTSWDAGAASLQPKVNLKGVCESRADVGQTAYKLLKVEKNVERNSLEVGVDYFRCVQNGTGYKWKSIPADSRRDEKTPDGRKISLWQTDVEMLVVDEDSKILGSAPLKLDSRGRLEISLAKKIGSLGRVEMMIRGHQYYELQGEAPVSDGVSTSASYMLDLNGKPARLSGRDCKPSDAILNVAGLKHLPHGMLPEGMKGTAPQTGDQAMAGGDCPMIVGETGKKSVNESSARGKAGAKAAGTAVKATGN